MKHNNLLHEKLKESLTSVLPVCVIVYLLCFTCSPIPTDTLMAFTIGSSLLIVGMGLFTLGADIAMTPIGESIGTAMTKSKNLVVIVLVSFLVGVIITLSEPDLSVLANQVPTIPNGILIGVVAFGVGIFLVVALLRILFHVRLAYLLLFFYLILFFMTQFVSPDFLSVSFDSGGVTTGPMTVPFIMALGVGVSSIRSDRQAGSDTFGLVALCSIGPIMSVLSLGMVYQPSNTNQSSSYFVNAVNSKELWNGFMYAIPTFLKDVGLALAPILLFFIVFQIISLKLPVKSIIRIFMGIIYTFLGLTLFLTGVNIGFMPAGNYIGLTMGKLDYNFILIPVGIVLGFFIVSAEPADHVLNKQVEEITSGYISATSMKLSLSIGVGISIGLSMLRVLSGISILWFLIPGYILALVLTFFVPPLFTSIAFDSGGVASGPMTATFLLSFAIGACEAVGGNIVTDAFGMVALVAMTPLITIQSLGLIYNHKTKHTIESLDEKNHSSQDSNDIIDTDSL